MHRKGSTSVVRGGPCILEIRRDLGIGSEVKVFVDACPKRLKVICCWEDGIYIIWTVYFESGASPFLFLNKISHN